MALQQAAICGVQQGPGPALNRASRASWAPLLLCPPTHLLVGVNEGKVVRGVLSRVCQQLFQRGGGGGQPLVHLSPAHTQGEMGEGGGGAQQAGRPARGTRNAAAALREGHSRLGPCRVHSSSGVAHLVRNASLVPELAGQRHGFGVAVAGHKAPVRRQRQRHGCAGVARKDADLDDANSPQRAQQPGQERGLVGADGHARGGGEALRGGGPQLGQHRRLAVVLQQVFHHRLAHVHVLARLPGAAALAATQTCCCCRARCRCCAGWAPLPLQSGLLLRDMQAAASERWRRRREVPPPRCRLHVGGGELVVTPRGLMNRFCQREGAAADRLPPTGRDGRHCSDFQCQCPTIEMQERAARPRRPRCRLCALP